MTGGKALFVGVVASLLPARPVDRQAAALPACDPDNGGITLPAGFCAVVVADQVGAPRHLAVAPNGDLFVALQSRPGGVLALRDTTGDGKADITERFGSEGGTGIALGKGELYFSSTTTVYRYAIRAGSLVPLGEPDVIVRGLANGGHAARNLARSEEHTSELQSRLHLGCRLLLEKKKIYWRRCQGGDCRIAHPCTV